MVNLVYSVATFRAAGLEAKCSRTRHGAPCYLVRNPHSSLSHQRQSWWMVDAAMWRAMNEDGVVEGFDRCTLLGDLFSITAA